MFLKIKIRNKGNVSRICNLLLTLNKMVRFNTMQCVPASYIIGIIWKPKLDR
jgi:hypothetical protein